MKSGLRSQGGGHSSDDQFGVGAIPEPATWLSMIIGFGLIGSLLRRARRWTLVVQRPPSDPATSLRLRLSSMESPLGALLPL